MKLFDLTNLTKKESAIRAVKKDKAELMVNSTRFELLKSNRIRSTTSSNEEAKIVGIDIITDKCTLLSLENPSNNAPEIVLPDLEVPGMRAKVCQTPMIKASL